MVREWTDMQTDKQTRSSQYFVPYRRRSNYTILQYHVVATSEVLGKHVRAPCRRLFYRLWPVIGGAVTMVQYNAGGPEQHAAQFSHQCTKCNNNHQRRYTNFIASYFCNVCFRPVQAYSDAVTSKRGLFLLDCICCC